MHKSDSHARACGKRMRLVEVLAREARERMKCREVLVGQADESQVKAAIREQGAPERAKTGKASKEQGANNAKV